VPAERLDGAEDKAITFPVGRDATRTMAGFDYLTGWMLPNLSRGRTGWDATRTMAGFDYLTGWMLPNLFFHVTTDYNILRHNGVDVGKGDYLLGSAARAPKG